MALTVYALKPRFQNLLRGFTGALARAGVTANQVTVAAMLGSLAFGAALWLAPSRALLLALPCFLFLRMAANAIDGMLAREHGMASTLGAILNEVGDVVADLALYVPLLIALGASLPAVTLALAGMFLVEFVGVLGPMIGATRRYEGPFGKSDRAFLFGALALGAAFYPPGGTLIDVIAALAVAASLVTAINRARAALAQARH